MPVRNHSAEGCHSGRAGKKGRSYSFPRVSAGLLSKNASREAREDGRPSHRFKIINLRPEGRPSGIFSVSSAPLCSDCLPQTGRSSWEMRCTRGKVPRPVARAFGRTSASPCNAAQAQRPFVGERTSRPGAPATLAGLPRCRFPPAQPPSRPAFPMGETGRERKGAARGVNEILSWCTPGISACGLLQGMECSADASISFIGRGKGWKLKRRECDCNERSGALTGWMGAWCTPTPGVAPRGGGERRRRVAVPAGCFNPNLGDRGGADARAAIEPIGGRA